MKNTTTITEVANQELGLYDSNNGKSVLATKIVDASDFCKKSPRCVIKYATVERGDIAQVNNWYYPDRDLGSSVHYFIDEMNLSQLASDIVFERTAKSMGAKPLDLAEFIYNNRP